MSEILRAVLDATCIDSQPAFYSTSITTVSPVTGAVTFAQRQGTIQCKSDTWFLMMSWFQDSAFTRAGGPYLWDSKTYPYSFIITDLSDNSQMMSALLLKGLANYNLNNSVILPEYKLWAPSSTIGITQNVQVTEPATVTNDIGFVTLAGIEYRMPAGKG